jgi:DNA-directed RNA polymerase subunit RPC12/RpoP
MSGNDNPMSAQAKCKCNNCSEWLEFDTSQAGSTIQCPHCGMDTILFVPKMTAPPPSRPPPIANSNLVICPDCGNSVSKLADSCPKCGRPIMAKFRRQMEDKDKKNFAGMIIIVVILLLFALFLVLFH